VLSPKSGRCEILIMIFSVIAFSNACHNVTFSDQDDNDLKAVPYLRHAKLRLRALVTCKSIAVDRPLSRVRQG